jgi:hypothetical protein
MKQSKMQADPQNQQKPQAHQQQKQQQKTRDENGPKKLVKSAKNDTTYQEHEHPEARMTD